MHPKPTTSLALLLPIQLREIDGEPIDSVLMTELHDALEIRKKPTDWIVAQVLRCALVRGIDIIEVLPQKGKQTGSGGHNRKDWILSAVAAKKIAMASGGAMGDAVRDYFLEMERRALAPLSLTPLEKIQEGWKALAGELETERAGRLLAEAQIEADKPAVRLAHKIAATDQEVTISSACKSQGLIRPAVFEWLKRDRHLFFRDGYLQVSAAHIDARRFVMRRRSYTVNGEGRYSLQALVLPKGLLWLEAKCPTDCRKGGRVTP